MSRPLLRRLAAASAGLLVVVTGCGGGDDDESADTVTAAETTTTVEDESDDRPPDTEPPVTDPPVTEPTATEPPATNPPDTVPAATASATTTTESLGGGASTATEPPATAAPPTTPANDPSCLVGNWIITNEEMNAYYDALVAASAVGGFDIDVPTGEVGLVLTPDTFEYSADFILDLDIAGRQERGTTSGSVTGTWGVEDGIITTELGESSLSLVIEVAGTTIDGSDFANGLLTSVPINDAPYECAGPTIFFQTGDGTPRHPVVLTPA